MPGATVIRRDDATYWRMLQAGIAQVCMPESPGRFRRRQNFLCLSVKPGMPSRLYIAMPDRLAWPPLRTPKNVIT